MKFTALIVASVFGMSIASKADIKNFGDQLKARLQEEAAKNRKQEANRQTAAVAPAAAAVVVPSLVCNAAQTKMNLCYAFSGTANSEAKVKKGNELACKMMRSKLIEASVCPTEKLLGKCTVLANDPKEYTVYYYSGRLSKSAAQSDCGNAKSSIHAQGAGVWAE